MMGESSELFVNCLEAMVETCLPVEELTPVPPSPKPYHLSSSLSSLTLGSPTDKGTFIHLQTTLIYLTTDICVYFTKLSPLNLWTAMKDSAEVLVPCGGRLAAKPAPLSIV